MLENARLMVDRHEGTLCRVDLRGVDAVRHYLDHFRDRALAAFKAAAAAEE